MREGLLLHSGSVITHQLLERLVQTGGGQAADHAGQDGAGIEGRISFAISRPRQAIHCHQHPGLQRAHDHQREYQNIQSTLLSMHFGVFGHKSSFHPPHRTYVDHLQAQGNLHNIILHP